ncbi:MAG: DNRLRE domain-containing protein, partial [Myxococcota bacterium]
MNGWGGHGTAFNHINIKGLIINGALINGIGLNGKSVNGTHLNGKSVNGKSVNNLALNGKSVNSLELNGKSVNGTELNGKSVNQMKLNDAPVDAVTEPDTLKILHYLATCALSSSQCITVDKLDGSQVQYCGDSAEAHDTGWDTSIPDLTKSDEVAECFVDRASADGEDAFHTSYDLAAFEVLLRYLVECALPEGDSLTFDDENDLPVTYHGALGLAPGWKTGAPSELEQQRVSACLAARSNALEQPVVISMRGLGIATDSVERELFRVHEGAFWGNVFSTTPTLNACAVTGGGISGRTCTQGSDCGFVAHGDCTEVCTSQDSGDGHYFNCNGESEVVNTFLNLGSDVSLGPEHNCTLGEDRSLWCWGRNSHGQLGAGFTSFREYVPRRVAALYDTNEVIGGAGHTCARQIGGTSHCWGRNSRGEIGDGTRTHRSTPTAVSALGSDTARIAAYDEHSCAIKTNGELYCWGRNTDGQVGDGTTTHRETPVLVSGLGQVGDRTLGSHTRTTCVISVDGDLSCWGHNKYGQVGDGTTADRHTPAAVDQDSSGAAFDQVTDVCSGIDHTCARRSDGTVYCWGRDSDHQLGNDAHASTSAHTRPVPVAFPGAVMPSGLSCGDRHTCAIRDDGTLWCWGDNDRGQLGTGTTSTITSPTQVGELGTAVALVSLTADYSCATTVSGKRHCWGRDDEGILFADSGSISASPVAVAMDTPLTPTDDSYVDSAAAGSNFGGLGVAKGDDNRRRWLLQFDLNAISGTSAQRAVLSVYSVASGDDCTLYRVADDSWDEMTVTWNNQPALGSSLATDIEGSRWIDLDITGYVNDELAGDRTLSVAVANCDDDTYEIATKENAETHLAPV